MPRPFVAASRRSLILSAAPAVAAGAACAAIAAMLACVSPAHAQLCSIVDRGSPVDGVTTITVTKAPAPCVEPEFAGWMGMEVTSEANDNGAVYAIDIRWNRVDQAARGTFTWMMGGPSTASARLTFLGGQVQDRLDTLQRVRSVEIRMLGQGTMTPPQNGFPNISAVLADVLEYLVTNGIAMGAIGHFGSSGGSMMCANALAYHDLEQLVDGVVMGGGPFWIDLRAVCTVVTDPTFSPDSTMRATVDDWNFAGPEGGTYCYDMSPAALPIYECRSTLGPEADREYPSEIVSVVIGTQESNNPWMDISSSDYMEKITALEETFDRPVAPHYVMTSQAGADVVYQRVTEIVDAYSSVAVPDIGFDARDANAHARTSPNPFVSTSALSFALPRAGRVRAAVYDVQGGVVRVLADNHRAAGRYELEWSGEDARGRQAPPGVYFYQLETPEGRTTLKTTRMR